MKFTNSSRSSQPAHTPKQTESNKKKQQNNNDEVTKPKTIWYWWWRERNNFVRTLTEEHNTAEDVSRDADAEDEGIEVAEHGILYGGESLKSNNVIGVVPRNIVVRVTIVFAVVKVEFNLHCRRYSILDFGGDSAHNTALMPLLFVCSFGFREQTSSSKAPVYS